MIGPVVEPSDGPRPAAEAMLPLVDIIRRLEQNALGHATARADLAAAPDEQGRLARIADLAHQLAEELVAMPPTS